ncbi:MAG: LptF/LptG family permease [Endomicrobia bacterium]|jgi:lipopolysaccharide export LptBFGC system permease protein LptF|nr:LptF/LptG family permease [Endomicrobiia bacterium]
MIKKLHLYIIKEFFGSFIFGLTVFSMILLLDQVFQLVDLFLSKGVAFWIVLKLFIFILPNILSLAIPMAVLFGVLIAYGRLSEDNEITAMKATGADYRTLSVPVIIFVALISVFLVFFNHFWSPSMHGNFRNLFEEIIMKRPLVKFDEKSIITLGEYQIYANKVNSLENTMSGVNIYRFDQEKKRSQPQQKHGMDQQGAWRIAASSASVKVFTNGIQMQLYNGYWQRANPADMENMIHTTFKTYTFFIPLEDARKANNTTMQQMSSAEILKTIKQYKGQNLPYAVYAIEFWMRWILALAPIAFVLVALPIGIMAGKGGKAIGFGMSLVVIFVYYLLLVIAMNVSEKGYVDPKFIMWLPNAVISGVGIFLFTKMVKK